jgi:hypothetical protein
MNNLNNIQHDLVAERTATIVRNIVSGNNACGTLIDAQGRLNTAFVAEAVRPAVQVCIEEANMLRRDNDALRRDIEAKRFALEFIAANLDGSVKIADPAITDAIKRALPGRLD